MALSQHATDTRLGLPDQATSTRSLSKSIKQIPHVSLCTLKSGLSGDNE